MIPFRVGNGWDSHRLVPDRPLILGGVRIPFEKGLLGHSDADVLTHAVIDALLGAAGLPDIGRQFPDTDPAYKGADSLKLLERTCGLVAEAGFALINVDAVIKAEQPRMAPHIPQMKEKLAQAMDIPMEAISLKAKTAEGLGDVGEGRAMEAWAVCLLEKKES